MPCAFDSASAIIRNILTASDFAYRGKAAVSMMVPRMMMMFMVMVVFVTVEPFHIVIMVLLLQDDIEVARIDSRFLHAAYPCRETIEGKRAESLLQLDRIDAQVNQGSDGHVTADSGIAFQI